MLRREALCCLLLLEVEFGTGTSVVPLVAAAGNVSIKLSMCGLSAVAGSPGCCEVGRETALLILKVL
jgi:hypothetical protein